MDNFTDLSNELVKILDNKTKKQFGIFFTPKEYRKRLFEVICIHIQQPKIILEPSFGSGEFIYDIQQKYPEALVDAVEINQVLFSSVSKTIQNTNVKLYNMDFLQYEPERVKKYDLIIGNPPYVVTKQVPKEYSHITTGRANLYCIFLHKSIQLLQDNGVLAFVLPSSILNSSYYELLRKYIMTTCDIIDISEFDKTKFLETNQITLCFVLKKTASTKKFVVEHKGKVLFNKNFAYITHMLTSNKTLHDLDICVKTGSIIWNEHKSKLTADKTKGILLIYPTNMKHGKIVIFEGNQKNKQYIITKKNTIKGPVILMIRGYGNAKYKLNVVFVDDESEFLVENHVNVIYSNNNDKILLSKIHDYLLSNECSTYIDKFTGNGAMSKTEIQLLLPIQLN